MAPSGGARGGKRLALVCGGHVRASKICGVVQSAVCKGLQARGDDDGEIMSLFSGGGSIIASNKQGKAAKQAAGQQAEGQRLARRDIQIGGQNARNVLQTTYNDNKALWEPVLDGADSRMQAIMYENGLGPAPEGYEGIQSTPGFDFLESEGRKNILNRASAMGGINSGSVLKELSRYQTDLDAQNYQSGYNRLAGLVSRDDQTRNALSNLTSNFGSNFANTHLNQATQSANTQIGQANALADGTIRSGNASAQGTQALFNIPQNFLNEQLQVSGAVLDQASKLSQIGATSFTGGLT